MTARTGSQGIGDEQRQSFKRTRYAGQCLRCLVGKQTQRWRARRQDDQFPHRRITLSVRSEGGDAVIRVSDNGVGIPADMQSRVFQLFAQVDNHMDRAQGGLGIGLALVKQLVTLHGGTVDVESAGAGKGSAFTVRLPLAARPELQPAVTAPEESPLAESAADPPPERSLKVLVYRHPG